MKQNTHPEYQEVLFEDSSTGAKFLIGTTLKTTETGEFEGKTYPKYSVPVSSSSHPFFKGSTQFVDTEGRVDRFKRRYEKAKKKKSEEEE